MKKIFGLILCMGIFIFGAMAAHASPPGEADVRYETVAAPTDIAVPAAARALSFEVFASASEQAMRQALIETAAERAKVTDTSAITRIVAELRANAVDRALVAKLIKKMDRHRWRCLSDHHGTVPTVEIYRPGWRRKVCEG